MGLLASCVRFHGAADTLRDSELFERSIRPLFVDHCVTCHGPSANPGGGLRLDTAEDATRGGMNGPAWNVKSPDSSAVLQVLTGPHPSAGGKRLTGLPHSAASDLKRWIIAGAAWPAPVANNGGARGEFPMAERKARLPWIWQRPVASTPPIAQTPAGSGSMVDRFVVARLQKEGLKPAPPVAPSLWLRRVHFALTGLPPSIADIAAFEADPSPAARERVVDRLLASPRFGERWARHWMDLMRYAESRGHEGDYVIPSAFEYRDYLIRALNADVPYDQLVREHLAGDLLKTPRTNPVDGFNESVIGTGWAFLGEEIHAPVDTRQDECDRTDNRIDVLSKTFLGLTVSCARCHDHKFDAITQKDYYALAGFFISSGYRQVRFETEAREVESSRRLDALHGESDRPLRSAIAAAQKPLLGHLDSVIRAAAGVAHRAGAVDATGALHYTATNRFPEAWTAHAAAEAQTASVPTRWVESWTLALLNAAQGRDPVLAPLAAAALKTAAPAPSAKAAASNTALPTGARVLADYSGTKPSLWVTDGRAFGTGPTFAGDWILSAGKSGAPELRVATRTAAITDPVWSRVRPKSGTEPEPTLYGSWNRSGRVLRAPKQMLETGKVHYLVRGGGRVLASVDSQVLVTGPIHTVLVKEWPTSRDWRWVSHDLSDYAGHRVSLEFTPGPDADLELATIVESSVAPSNPTQPVANSLALAQAQSDSSLKSALQAWSTGLRDAGAAYASGDGAPVTLAWIDWQLSHPELFDERGGAQPEPLFTTLKAQLKARQAIEESIPWESRTAPALVDGNGVDEFLLKRGSPARADAEVPRRYLEAISDSRGISSPHSSGRRELADVLTSPDNTLVSRVMVNRVWHHLFGRGIVPTVDNFGYLGERPSHPELLDTLAVQFVERDQWSIKRLIRSLVLTETFAMDSALTDPIAEEKDPDNRLLHRASLRRLEGEAIRDTLLTVSGRITDSMYGVGVPLHPSQFIEARGLRAERGPLDGDGRRSIYTASRRNFLPMMMLAFDTPIPFTTNGRRNVSNVPAQMLFLMNDPFVHQQAEVCAERIRKQMPGATTDEQIQSLFLSFFSRRPTAAELQRCRAALQRKAPDEAGTDELAELCHALFGVKEFVYLR
jgi:hypothetical protein